MLNDLIRMLKFLGFSLKVIFWTVVLICATFTWYSFKGGLTQAPETKTYIEGEWDRSKFNPPVQSYQGD